MGMGMGKGTDVWGCENGWRGMEREKVKSGRNRIRRESCMSCWRVLWGDEEGGLRCCWLSPLLLRQIKSDDSKIWPFG